jgi:hypothetical protein
MYLQREPLNTLSDLDSKLDISMTMNENSQNRELPKVALSAPLLLI